MPTKKDIKPFLNIQKHLLDSPQQLSSFVELQDDKIDPKVTQSYPISQLNPMIHKIPHSFEGFSHHKDIRNIDDNRHLHSKLQKVQQAVPSPHQLSFSHLSDQIYQNDPKNELYLGSAIPSSSPLAASSAHKLFGSQYESDIFQHYSPKIGHRDTILASSTGFSESIQPHQIHGSIYKQLHEIVDKHDKVEHLGDIHIKSIQEIYEKLSTTSSPLLPHERHSIVLIESILFLFAEREKTFQYISQLQSMISLYQQQIGAFLSQERDLDTKPKDKHQTKSHSHQTYIKQQRNPISHAPKGYYYDDKERRSSDRRDNIDDIDVDDESEKSSEHLEKQSISQLSRPKTSSYGQFDDPISDHFEKEDDETDRFGMRDNSNDSQRKGERGTCCLKEGFEQSKKCKEYKQKHPKQSKSNGYQTEELKKDRDVLLDEPKHEIESESNAIKIEKIVKRCVKKELKTLKQELLDNLTRSLQATIKECLICSPKITESERKDEDTAIRDSEHSTMAITLPRGSKSKESTMEQEEYESSSHGNHQESSHCSESRDEMSEKISSTSESSSIKKSTGIRTKKRIKKHRSSHRKRDKEHNPRDIKISTVFSKEMDILRELQLKLSKRRSLLKKGKGRFDSSSKLNGSK
ncbi:hypothetical protein ADUPG1_010443 [Aduncisulcus paluster]|uniref:Uncharacterized protein n=1 Tax=Aduncisulcus paluster TaxID=2918883 RepID=A0ABQ5JRS0_9EUKA|nr:hypothetical protein ADUPG1_010443 [Aduncisulcus paluster]